MLHGLAETDGLPVEIGRRGNKVVAARLEFTNDIDDLERNREGRWTELGELRIGSRGAVAATWDGDLWTVELPMPAGDYRAETFSTADDDIGIRLTLV